MARAMAGGICEQAMVRWHRLGEGWTIQQLGREKGELWGWRLDSTQYNATRRPCPALLTLERSSTRRVTVEIQAIEGMSASKSTLTDVDSMKAFALRSCPDWIADVSAHHLYLNLAHHQVRIVRESTCDGLSCYAWDGRLFLVNAGGSHHFATAQYMAAALHTDVPIEANLTVHALDPEAVAALCYQFTMVLVDDLNSFHDAMRSFGATYYPLDLPALPEHHPPGSAYVVLLPRDHRRSRRAADALVAGGLPDVGEHLTRLAAGQIGRTARLETLDRTGEPDFTGAALRQRIEQAVETRMAEWRLASARP